VGEKKEDVAKHLTLVGGTYMLGRKGIIAKKEEGKGGVSCDIHGHFREELGEQKRSNKTRTRERKRDCALGEREGEGR